MLTQKRLNQNRILLSDLLRAFSNPPPQQKSLSTRRKEDRSPSDGGTQDASSPLRSRSCSRTLCPSCVRRALAVHVGHVNHISEQSETRSALERTPAAAASKRSAISWPLPLLRRRFYKPYSWPPNAIFVSSSSQTCIHTGRYT